MANAQDLGSCAARLAGSTPASRTGRIFPPRAYSVTTRPIMGHIVVHYREHIGKPSKRSEQFILNLPYDNQRVKVAYEYAKKVLCSRFVKAERFIKENPFYAARYARHVIKGPWTAAEKQIKEDMESFYYYAKYVKRNISGVEQVVRDSFEKKEGIYYVFLYCLYIRKKQWPLLEELIEKFYAETNYYYQSYADESVRYAKKFIKGRWEAIEEKVMNDHENTINEYASILSPSEKEEFHNKILMKLVMMPAPESTLAYYKRGLKAYAKKINLVTT